MAACGGQRSAVHRQTLVREGGAVEQVGALEARCERLEIAPALALAHPLVHAAHERVHVRELMQMRWRCLLLYL